MSDLLTPPAVLRKSRSGSETRKMRSRIEFRVDEAALIKIEMDATAAGMTISHFARSLVMGGDRSAIRAHRRPPVWAVLLSQLKGEAVRAGSNLNQLVRLANSGEAVPAAELAKALADVSAFYAHARRLLNED